MSTSRCLQSVGMSGPETKAKLKIINCLSLARYGPPAVSTLILMTSNEATIWVGCAQAAARQTVEPCLSLGTGMCCIVACQY
jgi:hypothetical protein